MLLPALPNNLHVLSLSLATSLSSLPSTHWRSKGTREETREDGDKLFFFPTKGWQGQREREAQGIGALSASGGSTLGHKGQGAGGQGGKERRKS